MAVVTPIATPIQPIYTIRTGTAQATTGQTDWFLVPQWATYATVDFNLTAVAGNTPLVTNIFIRGLDLTTRDDSFQFALAEHADLATVDMTAASHLVVNIGPGVTGIADDVTQAATGFSRAALNTVLPPVMGVTLTFDRTTGDETYTYTLSVHFRG
jgi:hypothetical protein